MATTADPTVSAHEQTLLAIIWAVFPFTIIMTALRFYARYLRRSIGYDDWTMLSAWILYTIVCSILSFVVVNGCLKHISDISAEHLIWIDKYQTVLGILSLWTAMLGKVAIGLLLCRLLTDSRTKWRQYLIWLSSFAGITLTILNTVVGLFVCNGPIWDFRSLSTDQIRLQCPRLDLLAGISVGQSLVTIWMDFLLAVLPLTFILKLKLPLRQRIVICILLSLGIFAGVCTIIRSIEWSIDLQSSDRTYLSYSPTVWTIIEFHIIFITGSMAPAKPVFDRIFFGKPIEIGRAERLGSETESGFKLPFVSLRVLGKSRSRFPKI